MNNKHKITFAAGVVVGVLAVMGSVYAIASNVGDKPEEVSTSVVTEQSTIETITEKETTAAVTPTTTAAPTQPPTTTQQETTTVVTTQGTTAPDLTGKVTKENFLQAQRGMTYDEVIEILGCEPRSVTEENGKTCYNWAAYAPESTLSDPYVQMVFENGIYSGGVFVGYKG